MSNINTVTVSGNIVRDPELKHVGANGTALLDFTIAVKEYRKRGEEWESTSHFFDVVLWGPSATSMAEKVGKGSGVTVTGSLRQEKWEDRDTGQKRSKVKISGYKVHVHKSMGEYQGDRPDGATGQPGIPSAESFNDNIPF